MARHDGTAVLIYDGDCGFCTASAQWVADRADGAFRVEPWQALELSEYGLTTSEVTTAAYFVDPDGTTHRGHLGVGRTLRSIGGLYGPLGLVVQVPPISWLAKPCYALVSKYRYRLPGSTDACRLPSPRAISPQESGDSPE